MKYKKWWLPAVFMVISAVLLICSIFVLPHLSKDDTGYGGVGWVLIGLGVWFFLPLPITSFVYARKVLEEGKDRFWMTLYNSVLMTSPLWVYYGIVHWELNEMDIVCLIAFIWCEMWAIVGLSGKGKYKKVAVWYVPFFLFVAALALELCIDNLLYMIFPDFIVAAYAILAYAVIPVSIFIYARACVKPRKKRVAFTVASAFLLSIVPFSSTIITAISGRLTFGSAWDVVLLVLIYAATFALYETVTLLGAGYKIKIKLPKKKKKAEKSDESADPETKEDN